MKRRIVAIMSLFFALPLLCGSLSVYADVSGVGGGGKITPSITYIDVAGDHEKFAEDHWIRQGLSGGVSEYSYINENIRGDSIIAEGRGLAGNGDYSFDFDLKKEGVGSLIFEFKEFKKYYDGTGGYFSLFIPTAAVPKIDLGTDRDLFLNIGSLKVEGILSKEEDTKCAVSYEREYRKGAKSLVSWSSVTGSATTGGALTRNILPTFLQTDEIVDKVVMKLEHTVNGIDVSAEQEWERVKIESQKVNNRTLTLSTGLFTNVRQKYEDLDSDLYTTVVRVSKELNEKVLFLTSFLYSHYRGHTIETVTDTSVSSFNENNPNNPANVYQDTVTLLPKVSISPVEHLLMDVGVKWDWVHKNAAGTYNRDKNPRNNLIDEYLNIKDEIMENKLGETVNLKYNGIENVTLFADGEFGQEIRHETNTQDSFGPSPTQTSNFLRATDTITYDYEYTVGSKYYPVPKVDVTAEFKRNYGTRNYNPNTGHVQVGDITNGYRGFLDAISYDSMKPLVMLNLKPFKWITCSFRYALDTTTYGVRTRVAEATEFARYRANIYSAGATFMPCEPLYLSLFYQYKEASTETQANGDGGGPVNLPTYNANVKTLTASCGYSPVKTTTVTGSYSFSRADNFNDFSSSGLPLGLDNFSQDASLAIENKLTRDLSLEFKYDVTQYNETSNNGIDDYIAHLFYTGVKAKF